MFAPKVDECEQNPMGIDFRSRHIDETEPIETELERVRSVASLSISHESLSTPRRKAQSNVGHLLHGYLDHKKQRPPRTLQ